MRVPSETVSALSKNICARGKFSGRCESSYSPGMTPLVSSMIPFAAAHALTDVSQFRYFESLEGSEGGGPDGLLLSTQCNIVWTSCTTLFSINSSGVNSLASFPEVLSIL